MNSDTAGEEDGLNGPMSPEQIRLVQESWRLLAANLGPVGDVFYQRLFELEPELREIFDGTVMSQQAKKFTDTMSFVVKGLDHFDMLGPAIGQLGSRHLDYGIKEEHYAVLRTALIDALKTNLGSHFSDATEEAWGTTYDALAEIMKAGPSGAERTIPGI